MRQIFGFISLVFLAAACSSAPKSSSDRAPANQDLQKSMDQSYVYNSAALHLVNSLAGKLKEKEVSAQICSVNAGDEHKAATKLVEAFQQDKVILPEEKNNITIHRQISCLGSATSKASIITALNKVCGEIKASGQWKVTKAHKSELQKEVQSTYSCMSME